MVSGMIFDLYCLLESGVGYEWYAIESPWLVRTICEYCLHCSVLLVLCFNFFFSLLMKACNLACKNEEALKTVMEIVARVVHLVISGDEPIWNCLCDIEEYVNLLSAN